MGPSPHETDVRSLQRRAEQAIRAAKPREYVVRLLEQLAAAAAEDSEAARFAHRHLAELRLEESPWRSALHLRRVLQQDPDDDIAQALMGLCQALQANFRSAVAAYRRAVALAPSNPWYNHNLGHLLDVALSAPRDALPYLRRAHKLEPRQDEVAASLAHCLGRVGAREEALELARGLIKRNPRDADHRVLLQWLEQGASAARDATVPGLLSAISPAAGRAGAAAREPQPGAPLAERAAAGVVTPSAPPVTDGHEVERMLVQSMARAGRASGDVERARSMWRDYARLARPVLGRPASLAAAIEYALARVDGVALKQKDVAERHGVSLSSLQTRYAAVRSILRLLPGDARYAARAGSAAPRSRDDERN